MTKYVSRAGLQIAEELALFVETRALPDTGISVEHLWAGLADTVGPLRTAKPRVAGQTR